MTAELRGTILTPGGWIAGRIAYAARIEAVEGAAVEDPSPPFVLPGFVDLHVHGGGGADMMEGAGAIAAATHCHARHGTTALLATSVTAPLADIDAFLDAVAASAAASGPGARILGAHLEGPFLNAHKLGAQPPFARPAEAGLVESWLARAPVRVVTCAPEADPGGQVRDLLLGRGVRVQIGHTLCNYATAAAALAAGAGVTHLFNAMSPLTHRENGAAGAALAHATHAEIIPDLVHVEPGAILAAHRAIPGLYGVTDATAGAGAPDGDYRLGTLCVRRRAGAMRLADGTLAGSALTMDAALRNLVSVGLRLDEAARRLSTIPADWLGDRDIGRLRPGARADLVVLDADLAVREVHVGGAPIGAARRWR